MRVSAVRVDSGQVMDLADRIITRFHQSDFEKIETLRQHFGTTVPIHLFFDIGHIRDVTPEDIRLIEAEFFDEEPQVKHNIELHPQPDGRRHLRLKRAHYRKIYVTIRGVDYPLVLAADYPEGRSVRVSFVS